MFFISINKTKILRIVKMQMFVWPTLLFFAFIIFGPSTAQDDKKAVITPVYKEIIAYITKNLTEVAINVLFGLTIAKAQLELIQLSDKKDGESKGLLDTTTKLHEDLSKNLTYPDKLKTFNAFMNSSKWHRSNSYETLVKPEPVPALGELLKTVYADYKDSSETCLPDIISSCKDSSECNTTYGDFTKYAGYMLTHAGFYWQIYEAFDCTPPQVKLKDICTKMAGDFNAIVGNKYTIPARDLFLTQVVVCGTENYQDFINMAAIDEILKWKKPEGCFALNDTYPCNEHMTGAAVATLAIYLKSSYLNVKP